MHSMAIASVVLILRGDGRNWVGGRTITMGCIPVGLRSHVSLSDGSVLARGGWHAADPSLTRRWDNRTATTTLWRVSADPSTGGVTAKSPPLAGSLQLPKQRVPAFPK